MPSVAQLGHILAGRRRAAELPTNMSDGSQECSAPTIATPASSARSGGQGVRGS